MKTYNLATVIAFEVRRTLAKPTFWIASLSVPLLMAFIFGLSFFSGMTAAQSSLESDAQPVTFTYTDASGIVVPEVASSSAALLPRTPPPRPRRSGTGRRTCSSRSRRIPPPTASMSWGATSVSPTPGVGPPSPRTSSACRPNTASATRTSLGCWPVFR